MNSLLAAWSFARISMTLHARRTLPRLGQTRTARPAAATTFGSRFRLPGPSRPPTGAGPTSSDAEDHPEGTSHPNAGYSQRPRRSTANGASTRQRAVLREFGWVHRRHSVAGVRNQVRSLRWGGEFEEVQLLAGTRRLHAIACASFRWPFACSGVKLARRGRGGTDQGGDHEFRREFRSARREAR